MNLVKTRMRLIATAVTSGGITTAMFWLMARSDRLEDFGNVMLLPGAIVSFVFLDAGVHSPGAGMFFGFLVLGVDWLFYFLLAFAVLKVLQWRTEPTTPSG